MYSRADMAISYIHARFSAGRARAVVAPVKMIAAHRLLLLLALAHTGAVPASHGDAAMARSRCEASRFAATPPAPPQQARWADWLVVGCQSEPAPLV